MSKFTLLTHVKNEEFLIPYFIAHHKNKFDEVIVLDNGSTDTTLAIIEKEAPNWKIVRRNNELNGEKIDLEILQLEKEIQGFRIVLTATEFFMGNVKTIRDSQVIPSINLVHMENDLDFVEGVPFHLQRRFGRILPNRGSTEWSGLESILKKSSRMPGRYFHNITDYEYPTGRHFPAGPIGDHFIYRVSDCYVNSQMYERRLKLQSEVPTNNIEFSNVHHTNFGLGLSIQDLYRLQQAERLIAVDLQAIFDKVSSNEEVIEKISKSMRLTEIEVNELLNTISSKNATASKLYIETYSNNQVIQQLQASRAINYYLNFTSIWKTQLSNPLKKFLGRISNIISKKNFD